MTRFKFLQSPDGHIIGFSMQGHAGYAAHGEDIVCAGISGSAYLIEMAMTSIPGCENAFRKYRAKTKMVCQMPGELSEENKEKFYLLTDSFYRYMIQLERQYRKHIYVVKRRLNHA